MPQDASKDYKRRNKTLSLADVLTGALDPVLKKRGFASRDMITHWQTMAPEPYNRIAVPDRLTWPRGERSAEGATLTLRCMPGHALAIQYQGPQIAAAINRYFGYMLVKTIRLSAEPFTPGSDGKTQDNIQLDQNALAKVEARVSGIENDDLREALRTLGLALASRSQPGRK